MATDPEHPMDLARPADARRQHREWRTERIAWAVMGLILLAGFLGLLGGGFFSRHSISAGRLTLVYERVLRRSAPADLEVIVDPVQGDTLRFQVAEAWLAAMRLGQVRPPAGESFSRSGRLVLVYPGAKAGTRFHLLLRIEPAAIGRVPGFIAAATDSIRFTQFVLP